MPKKIKKKSKNPVKKTARAVTQTITRTTKKIEPDTIAKGATAISIAAGMVAAGAALIDKENRKKIGKTAAKGIEFMQDMTSGITEEAQGRYQAVHMSIPLKGSLKKDRSSTKQSKGRSKKR